MVVTRVAQLSLNLSRELYDPPWVSRLSGKRIRLGDWETSLDVKKPLVVGAGACGAAAIALMLVGAGVANADDQVVGQTYKDAKAAIGQMGLTPVVATTVGDRKDWDDCIVTSANKAPFLDESGNKTGNQMLVNLNCYGKYSTGNWPGFSLQSPEGRKMYEADLAAKQQREAEAAAAQQQA
ncbi:MAG TPA: hypothetical protein VI029_07310, partial [Mycobacterium sp.]